MLKINTLHKIVYIIKFIILAILTYVLLFTNVNNMTDYIFGYLYFIICIFIYYGITKLVKDPKAMISWIIQMIVLGLAIVLELYLVVKALVLIGIIFGVIDNFKRMDKFQDQNLEIKYLSLHDEMTGVYNRRYFENMIKEYENKEVKIPVSVIMGDINNLKIINDSLGHLKGDEYIKTTASIIKSVLRKEDIMARIGGDEFAILLPNTNVKQCQNVVLRIKKAINEYTIENINIALGYATNRGGTESLSNTISRADRMMYRDKEQSKVKEDLHY